MPYQVFENEFNDGCLMYGYICGNEIIGFVSLSVKMHEMHINDIVVLPMYQNRGIGSKLMQFVIEKAKELKCSKISLGMVHDNIQLRIWYQKLGFKTVRLKNFDSVSYTVGKMELLL